MPIFRSGPGERSSLGIQFVLPHPGLSGNLDGVPRRAQGRAVGEVEFAHGVDGHVVVNGGGKNVDPLGDFGPAPADQLGAEQHARLVSPVIRIAMG